MEQIWQAEETSLQGTLKVERLPGTRQENTLHNYEEIVATQATAQLLMERNRDHVKFELESLDTLEHFSGLEELQEKRSTEYQMACKKK